MARETEDRAVSDVTRPVSVPEALIARARAGDQRAFDLVFAAYNAPLLRYLRTIAPAMADDVSAATWESVARSLDRFSGDGDGFRGWIFTIARRRLTDHVRSQSRRPVVLVDELGDCVAPEADSSPVDWAAEVLRRIPVRQADVVSLRVVGGLGVDEVASLLGITPENVRVLSHRGLNAIKTVLAEDPGVTTDASSEQIRFVV